MLETVNPSKWSLIVKSYYHTLKNQLISISIYSPVILARKVGQPHTNCNKSKLNGYGFLGMS